MTTMNNHKLTKVECRKTDKFIKSYIAKLKVKILEIRTDQ